MITNYVVHHPVVVQQAAARYSDYQLRIADRITAFAGSMLFVYLHVALFAGWMLVLERSPWPTLTLVVSLEAIFLSTFVMIGQNRQAAFQRGQGRPRLRGAGAGAQAQHRADPRDPRAHAGAAPDAGGLHGETPGVLARRDASTARQGWAAEPRRMTGPTWRATPGAKPDLSCRCKAARTRLTVRRKRGPVPSSLRRDVAVAVRCLTLRSSS